MDARVLYKDLESKDYIGGTGKVPRGVEMVSVVEVMSDRFGGSVGGWGVFGTGERGMKSV